MQKKTHMLIILDGWGIRAESEGGRPRLIEATLDMARFHSEEARAICKIGAERLNEINQKLYRPPPIVKPVVPNAETPVCAVFASMNPLSRNGGVRPARPNRSDWSCSISISSNCSTIITGTSKATVA